MENGQVKKGNSPATCFSKNFIRASPDAASANAWRFDNSDKLSRLPAKTGASGSSAASASIHAE
jgi:hypothetical protein